jgi:membrane-bound lytic murein transglycosylase D
MKKIGLPLVTLILLLFVFVAANSKKGEALLNSLCEYTIEPIPDQLFFAGQQVPLHKVDVKERLDRELLVNSYWHSNTFLLLKRANKYFPVIEPILKKYGIPDEFKYICVIESSLTNAVSPAGARGFWQIMPETAKELGLEVTTTVDERYHIEKSTEAACKYFLKSKESLGSWVLAAASYNIGLHAMSKRLKMQQVTDYYDLLLPEETARYILRIIAVREILENPKKYGFIISDKELYHAVPTSVVQVDTSITDLADFAVKNGINYKALKIHNPWLRETYLENKQNKQYAIEIPLKGY